MRAGRSVARVRSTVVLLGLPTSHLERLCGRVAFFAALLAGWLKKVSGEGQTGPTLVPLMIGAPFEGPIGFSSTSLPRALWSRPPPERYEGRGRCCAPTLRRQADAFAYACAPERT